MNQHFLKIAFALALASFGCASPFKQVNLNQLRYSTPVTSDSLAVSYVSRLQNVSKNNPYATREKKHKLNTVAIRIENTSQSPVAITPETFRIHSDQASKVPISAQEYSMKVKQSVAAAIPFMFLGLSTQVIDLPESFKSPAQIANLLSIAGFTSGVFNGMSAHKANRECKAFLELHEIWGREITPGQTLSGILIIPSGDEDALTFSYSRNPVALPSNQPDSVALYWINYRRPEFDFIVVPTAGTTYTIRSRMVTTGTKEYVIGPNRMRVYPEDTKSIIQVSDKRRVTGIPHDNRWIFKLLSGEINAYVLQPNQTSDEIAYIQKGEGEILPYKPWVLSGMTDNDSEVDKLIKQGKLRKAIEVYNGREKVK